MIDREMTTANDHSDPVREAEKTEGVVAGRIRVPSRTTTTTVRQAAPTPLPEVTTNKRPLRVAKMLALGHQLRKLIDGNRASEDTLAKRLKMSPGRISQLVDLTFLAPDIQEEILFWEVEQGRDPITEYGLRFVLGARDWIEQRLRWGTLLKNRSTGHQQSK